MQTRPLNSLDHFRSVNLLNTSSFVIIWNNSDRADASSSALLLAANTDTHAYSALQWLLPFIYYTQVALEYVQNYAKKNIYQYSKNVLIFSSSMVSIYYEENLYDVSPQVLTLT